MRNVVHSVSASRVALTSSAWIGWKTRTVGDHPAGAPVESRGGSSARQYEVGGALAVAESRDNHVRSITDLSKFT